MNSKKIRAALFAAIVASAALAAQVATQLEAGARRSEAGKIYTLYTDPSGFAFEMSGVSDENLEAAYALALRIRDLPGLAIASLVIDASDEGLSFRVKPEALTYGSLNMLPYLPEGLKFIFTSYLEFDFHVKVKTYIIKVRGTLANSTAFLDYLASAIKDPADFIKKHDLDYAVRRINELEENLDTKIQKTTEVVKDEIQRKTEAVKGEITTRVDKLESGVAISAKADQLDAAVKSFEARIKALEASVAEQKSLVASLSAALRRYAMLSGAKKVDFNEFAIFKDREIPSQYKDTVPKMDSRVVSELLRIRADKPDISVAAALSALSAKGLSATEAEVTILYTYY
jgi:hypothetical protein